MESLRPPTMAQPSVALTYFRFLPEFPVGFDVTFFAGALAAAFFPAGLAGALPVGFPLGAALGGGAV